MSGATVSGSSVPNNFTGAGGGAFSSVFSSSTPVTYLSGSGVSTVTGAVAISVSGGAVTLSGSAVADLSTGGNTITTVNPATIFAAPNDTITSAAASTIFGAGSGNTIFTAGGANSSITGGAGSISGSASGANTTLVGGTGGAAFTVGGSGSLAVAGPTGATTITLNEASGGSEIATSPIKGPDTGTLVATLSAHGADSVIGGGGASTITGGSGDDVFGFVNGHAGGSETIKNFTSSDTFAFGGYGSSPIKSEVFTAYSPGTGPGNDVIVLTDNTTITVVDVNAQIF